MSHSHESTEPIGKKAGLSRAAIFALCLILIVVGTVGATAAYLVVVTVPAENRFLPSTVSCSVTEQFDGTVKTNVNVTNTGDIPAYVRVRLVSYRVNDAGQHIGGAAPLPDFTPGSGWVRYGDHYYYSQPVAPGSAPGAPLISSMTLQRYTDADGGRQVVEVMAEAIQSQGTDSNGTTAIQSAWGVTVAGGSVSAAS